MGDGLPLVHMPPTPLGHLAAEVQNPANGDYYHRLAQQHRLIRYDGRGTGLSDRDVSSYSPESHAGDVDGLVRHLGLERFALLGFGHSGPAAIAYAALNPDRVSHLILWHSYARASDVTSLSRIEAARQLIQKDWDSYTRLEGYRVSGFRGGAAARWYTEYVKQSVTPEGLVAAYEAISRIDVRISLRKVKAPTLVMARRGSEVLPLEVARELTTTIPDARLVLLEGTGVIPFPDVVEQFVSAVNDFLAGTPDQPQATRADPSPGILTPRELEILRLLAMGRSSGDVSRELSLSVRTVGRHITNIYAKIGARTRADATAYAIRHEII